MPIVAFSQDTAKGTITIKKIDIDTTAYTIVEQMPEMEDMRIFIAQNIVYPVDAVNGTTYVNFIVEKDGSINRVRVIRGNPNCPQCDAEAVRVIKMMPKWKPGRQNGNLVRVSYNLPIKFALK